MTKARPRGTGDGHSTILGGKTVRYINQKDHWDIPYYHNTENGGPAPGRNSVATSGCGLCSMCMVVDHLTVQTLTLEECVRISESCGANRKVGTMLRVLGPVVAERFDLAYSTTNDKAVLVRHLQSGGEAIVNVACNADGTPGLFTKGGHYMVVVCVDGDTVCILDPDYKPGKFDAPERVAKVKEKPPFLYCSLDALMQEASNRDPGFYLFKRK